MFKNIFCIAASDAALAKALEMLTPGLA